MTWLLKISSTIRLSAPVITYCYTTIEQSYGPSSCAIRQVSRAARPTSGLTIASGCQ